MSEQQQGHEADATKTPDTGKDPSGQDAHNPETEEDTASGGPA